MKRILYRDATKEDWPAIQALHAQQQEQQGTKYELPELNKLTTAQIPIVLVGEDEDGVIRNCFYCEAVAELRFVGCDPRATALSQREADGLCYVLKAKGFRYLECFVPRQLKEAIAKPLKRARFESKDEELSYFSRDLRGKP
jgi:hypothetical protein